MSLILVRVPSATLVIGSLHISMPQAKLLAFASSAAIWHQAYVAPCLNIIFQSPSCLPEDHGSTLLYENQTLTEEVYNLPKSSFLFMKSHTIISFFFFIIFRLTFSCLEPTSYTLVLKELENSWSTSSISFKIIKLLFCLLLSK